MIEAAMKSREATISFSPCGPETKLLDSTQIRMGTMKMRLNVMELGRFNTDATNLIMRQGKGLSNGRQCELTQTAYLSWTVRDLHLGQPPNCVYD